MAKVGIEFFFRPAHASSLAIARIFYGFLMLFDIADERGGSEIDIRWGDPKTCHFILLPFMPQPSYAWICIMYGVMWFGALGICVGYKFRMSCIAFLVPYWYVLLLDKSFWNNHSYLYGLLAILFSISSVGNYWSLDVLLLKREKMEFIPYWNYFLLKFQLFCLYFFAGIKKLDMEWLEGYSMSNLGKHWVFSSFEYFLPTEQIDFFIIHLSGLLLDLTVGFFLIYSKTRPFALLLCGLFHVMNSRLFSIGMFPYVCLATMPLFCEHDWPLKLLEQLRKTFTTNNDTTESIKTSDRTFPTNRKALLFIFLYCVTQIFLPWSHSITKGFNNWTTGLYGYSWDMMIHSWDTTVVIVRIVDNENGTELFLDPSAWTNNDRWNKHGDMCFQYAQCIKHNFQMDRGRILNEDNNADVLSNDLSIYVDVWCSLNGRFQQRMFDPNYDLLKANWSPFKNVEWLLPLLIQYSDFREKMKAIQDHVYTWSNYSDVLFVADFPDLSMENFITQDLTNVSLVIIEGSVYYESEHKNQGLRLDKGESISITSNVFHKVTTISQTPSCFMYTYTNSTKEKLNELNTDRTTYSQSPFPLLEDSQETIKGLGMMFGLIGNAVLHLLYNVPIVRRERVA